MDHNQAIHGKFTERYLLGELTPALRDQFEEHYFDCAICADDVQAGATFIDNARAQLIEKTPVAVAQKTFAPYGIPFQAAACAFACLLCVLGYENIVTIPHLRSTSSGIRAPQILPAVSLLGMGSRAESNPVVAPAAKDFEFELEIPGGPEFSAYVCEIRDAGKFVKFSLPVSTEQAKNTLRLAIPGSALTAGKYEISVIGLQAGKAGQELIQYPVVIQ